MLEKLQAFIQEDKFNEGAGDWPGYSGCNDEYERISYSNNINTCIAILINAVNKGYDKGYMESIIKYHHEVAKNYLEEQFGADTDESEVRYMYFERICTICATRPLDAIMGY